MAEIPCKIIRDLLPLYSEGRTSPETNELIGEHTAYCGRCRKLYADECGEAPLPALETEPEEKPKKQSVRRKKWPAVLVSIALLIAVLSALFARFFVVGDRVHNSGVLLKLEVSGNKLTVHGSVLGEDRVVSGMKFVEDGGTVDIITSTAKKSPILKDEFTRGYDARSRIDRVKLNGVTIYEPSRDKGNTSSMRLSDEGKLELGLSHALTVSSGGDMVTFIPPGYYSKGFDTWDEAVEYMGFEPINPFEDDDAYVKILSAGTYEMFPTNQSPGHAELSFSGYDDGGIQSAVIEAGYSYEDVQIMFSAMPLSINYEGKTVSSARRFSSFPLYDLDYILGTSQTRQVVALDNNRDMIITQTEGASHREVELRYSIAGADYLVNVIDPVDGSEVFEEVVQRVTDQIRNMVMNYTPSF